MKNFHPIGSKILANNGVNFSSKDFPRNKESRDGPRSRKHDTGFPAGYPVGAGYRIFQTLTELLK